MRKRREPAGSDAVLGAAPSVLGGTDGFTDALARWAADAIVDEAARERSRARWLRLQEAEEATLPGTLLDLAERGRPVALHVAGTIHRGRIGGLGDDFVALRTDPGHRVLVRLDAVEIVRSEPGDRTVSGSRSSLLEVTLGGILVPLAAERPVVAARTRGGTVVRGELRSASPSILTIRPEGDAQTPTWVTVDALAALVLDP